MFTVAEDIPFTLIRVYDVTIPGLDGTPVKGWLLLPGNASPSNRVPCVVQFHGGGGQRNLDHWWAASGIAMLMADFRHQGGTTGSKTAFERTCGNSVIGFNLKKGPEDYYLYHAWTDQLLTLRAAFEHPCIDPERIAVWGQSQGGGTALLMGSLFAGRGKYERLVLAYQHIAAGATKPFSILHISDTHLTAAYDDEPVAQCGKAAARTQTFGGRQECALASSLDWASRNVDYVLHTGDLIDFTSQANFDMVRGHLVGVDSLVCAGNHEFSQYVGEAKEDAAYKAVSYAEVQKRYPNDLTFFSREMYGVNFVAVDNVYYDFTEVQLALMEKEIAKGLPIVVLCHVPLYSEALHARLLAAQGGKCAYMCGTPDALLGSDPARAEQQRANAATKAFVERLRKEPLVKAILCGHVHCPDTDRFSPTAIEYATGGNFMFHAREVLFS